MGLFRSFIRIWAFVGKELAEILRQPRLILTLVLGPFLILLLFGVGYRNQARALRTQFVVPPGQENGPLASQIKQYATSLGPQLAFSGVTSDESAARTALLLQQVDLVVLTPPDPYNTLTKNQQATWTLLHNEIDPLQVDYVRYFGQVYVNEVNRRVLQNIAEQGQQNAGQAQQEVGQARANASALRQALQAGDRAAAQQHKQSLTQNVNGLELALGASAGLVGSIQGNGGSNAPSKVLDPGAEQTSSGGNQGNDLNSNLQGIRADSQALSNNQGNDSEQEQRAAKLESDLARLDNQLTEFRNIDPHILVQPFRSDTRSLATLQPTLSDYFAPSVIVLLLQHLAITFGALSIVREQRLGAMELFRVSPVSAFEALAGKYVSYMIFGTVLAAILSGLVVFALRVPLLGDPRWYALVLAALLFTSLGVGFVISLVSQTDSQAVQYSMILLLCSVFFSGFMLSLENLIQPIRLVSWLLPATYGISLLQNIMLRGYFAQPILLYVLASIGAALFVLAWILLHRRMARS